MRSNLRAAGAPNGETDMTANAQDSTEPSLIERIEAALPIDDLVGWLISTYPAASEGEIMAMLQEVYRRDFNINPSGEPEQRYVVGEGGWTAFPQRVTAKA